MKKKYKCFNTIMSLPLRRTFTNIAATAVGGILFVIYILMYAEQINKIRSTGENVLNYVSIPMDIGVRIKTWTIEGKI